MILCEFDEPPASAPDLHRSPAMSTPHPEPLDPKVVSRLREVGSPQEARSLIAELYRGWLDDVPDRLRALRTAIDRHDLDDVERLAHGLQGTSASLGLPEVDARAARLELHARASDTVSAGAALDALSDAIGRARRAVERLPELH